MKKIKKIFALLMTVAMVMGLNVTVFAEKQTTPTSTITVKNLATDVETTVKVLNVVYYDKTKDSNGIETQSWVVVNWAKNYIKYNNDAKKYEIVSGKEEEFKQAAETASSDDENNVSFKGKTGIGKGEVVFKDVPVGAYVILASDSKNTYNLMVAETYKDGETYMTAEDATVIAKPKKYTTDKKDDDNLVKRGQTVNFTVTSYVPAKSKQTDNGPELLDKFIITDTPVGLKVTNIESVTIGTVDVMDEIEVETVVTGDTPTWDSQEKGHILIKNDPVLAETKNVEMDLLKIVNQKNDNGSEKYPAGSTITIKYSATVQDEIKYNNVISTNCNTVDYEPDEENGFEASIEVKKVDENGQTPLTDAQFEVTDSDANTKLSFVRISDGVYKLALNGESGASTIVEVGADKGNEGNLTLKGLDESEYLLTEIQAPNGYSGGVTKTVKIKVNDDGTAPVVTYGEDSQNIVNTKLSALPSTGGIGTTIFTIGGCAIMIAAAGLFFATRKKAEK